MYVNVLSSLVGFERLANQRLLPPTFPRYTEMRSRESAVEYFSQLVERISTAVHAVTQITTFQSAMVS